MWGLLKKKFHHEWRCHRKYNWKCLNKKEKAEIRSLLYQTFIFTAVQTQVRLRQERKNKTKTQKGAFKLNKIESSQIINTFKTWSINYINKQKKKSLITFKIILSPYCEDSFLNQP